MDEGASATYTVVLDALPASDVVITVTSDNSDVTASPATLTFTSSNWDTAQTVTVAAAEDADAVDDAASITHAVVAAGSADEYDDATIAGVAVTVVDDDAGVTVSLATLRITEGNSSTYTVVLDALPASDVVITVTRSGDVTPSPPTLTFTTANWNTAQTVTLRADHDDDAVTTRIPSPIVSWPTAAPTSTTPSPSPPSVWPSPTMMTPRWSCLATQL